MELSGEEKKLQALFSELKTSDEETTPHFGATWNRAQIAPRRIRLFNPAFVAATLLLVFGVVAFAVWSRHSHTTRAPQTVIATAANNTGTARGTEAVPSPESPLPKSKNVLTVVRRNKVTSHRNAELAAANRQLEKDAKSIANWSSPTSSLLESSSDEIINSLPQFNQSTTQLKSFLTSRSN